MTKCQNCGKENVPLFKVTARPGNYYACMKCYATIEKAERVRPYDCLKRKRVFP
jgi:hypothetical protein